MKIEHNGQTYLMIRKTDPITMKGPWSLYRLGSKIKKLDVDWYQNDIIARIERGKYA